MPHLNPYVTFNGNCREAMSFYRDCFGGELNLQTVEGSPAEAHCAPEIKHHILHASLTAGNIVIMGTDLCRGKYTASETIALCCNCGSAEEITGLFEKLSAGGQIIEPLKPQFWGALYGELTDRFGVRWMLNGEPAKEN